MRMFLFDLLRMPGEESYFRLTGKINSRFYNLPLMPLLCGDNPIINELPSQFLRLTERQLFMLRQWADGKFHADLKQMPKGYNPFKPFPGPSLKTRRALDKGVLGNILGRAFCPGGEVGWVMRNPSIYTEPYRVKADLQFSTFRMTATRASSLSGAVPPEEYTAHQNQSLSLNNIFYVGLQPRDLPKHMSAPGRRVSTNAQRNRLMSPMKVGTASTPTAIPVSPMNNRPGKRCGGQPTTRCRSIWGSTVDPQRASYIGRAAFRKPTTFCCLARDAAGRSTAPPLITFCTPVPQPASTSHHWAAAASAGDGRWSDRVLPHHNRRHGSSRCGHPVLGQPPKARG